MKKTNKGFTLAELLIVVAIIAVLVAVSIPIFVWQLEKSRESTDLANLRSAKAAAASMILAGDTTDDVYKALTAGTGVYYDADAGKLVTAKPSMVYGKGTSTTGDSTISTMNYTAGTVAADKVIKVTYNSTKTTFSFTWE